MIHLRITSLALAFAIPAFPAEVQRSNCTSAMIRGLTEPEGLPLPQIIRIKLSDRIAGDLPRRLSDNLLPYPVEGKGGTRNRVTYRKYHDEIASSYDHLGDLSGKELLKLFPPGERYSFVILPGEMKIARAGDSKLEDLFSKHGVISAASDQVRFAGILWVDEAGTLNIKNHSGTYTPPAEMLPQIASILQRELGLPLVKHQVHIR